MKGSDCLYVLDSILRPTECLQSGLQLAAYPSRPCRLWHRRSTSNVGSLHVAGESEIRWRLGSEFCGICFILIMFLSF